MGWPAFFWILYGAVIVDLVWLMIAAKMGMGFGFFAGSDSTPPGLIIDGAAVFCGAVLLAFLVFWTRPLFAWPFIRIRGWLRWLFKWLSAFALLVALFYAEEDWRGKRNWEQYKRAAEAKGERFDLSSFVPPAVPDDQNFVFAPLVSNSCFARIDGNGSGPDTANTNAGRRLEIRINARPDWKPWPTNGFEGNWTLGRRIDLKTFQDYYRTPVTSDQRTNEIRGRRRRPGGRAFPPTTNPEPVATNEFPVAPQPQSPVADVLLALSKYDSAVEELREASRRRLFWFPFQFRPETTNGFSNPNLAPLKECVLFLRLRAVAELENGQSEKALEDVKLMFYLANPARHESWRELGVLQGWRWGNMKLALQPVWQGLVDHEWSGAQLVAIDEGLAKFDFLSDYQSFVRSERAEIIEMIDTIEQRRLHVFWEQLYFGNDQDGNSLWDRVFNEGTLAALAPKGWFSQNDLAVSRLIQVSLRTDAEIERRILSAEAATRFQDAIADNQRHRSPCNLAASLAYYLMGRAMYFAFAQSSLDRARVACALERHRLAEGEYPAILDSLAPRFMEKLPRDIINGKPLHYRRTGGGRYLFYSVGWNGTDDGGSVVLKKGLMRPALDIAEGDWVWPNPE